MGTEKSQVTENIGTKAAKKNKDELSNYENTESNCKRDARQFVLKLFSSPITFIVFQKHFNIYIYIYKTFEETTGFKPLNIRPFVREKLSRKVYQSVPFIPRNRSGK